MSYPFATWRADIAARLSTFPRIAHDGEGLKRAAVVIALTAADDGSGETAFLLTRRAAQLTGHAGQWALPGGRCDPGETDEQAALRELNEELALTPSAGAILGMLDDYVTRSGYAMTPVVVWMDDVSAMRPSPDEVAAVYRIRLDSLMPDDAVTFLTIPESDRPVIRLKIGDQHLHAPTAAVIYQLRELAAGRVTRVADLEQPVFAWR